MHNLRSNNWILLGLISIAQDYKKQQIFAPEAAKVRRKFGVETNFSHYWKPESVSSVVVTSVLSSKLGRLFFIQLDVLLDSEVKHKSVVKLEMEILAITVVTTV